MIKCISCEWAKPRNEYYPLDISKRLIQPCKICRITRNKNYGGDKIAPSTLTACEILNSYGISTRIGGAPECTFWDILALGIVPVEAKGLMYRNIKTWQFYFTPKQRVKDFSIGAIMFIAHGRYSTVPGKRIMELFPDGIPSAICMTPNTNHGNKGVLYEELFLKYEGFVGIRELIRLGNDKIGGLYDLENEYFVTLSIHKKGDLKWQVKSD